MSNVELTIYCIFFAGFGGALVFLSFKLTGKLFSTSSTLKENYSGKTIPSIGGVLIFISLLVCSLAMSLYPGIESKYLASFPLLFVVLGFAVIGLIDDLIGDKSSQGFKGHIRELLKGNVTTGAIKLFGGPVISLLAFSHQIPERGYVPVFIDAVAVALIANLLNLFDLAPGRCSKISFLAIAITTIFLGSTYSFNYAMLGILLVVLVLDLREKFMLGDVGANLIGAYVGYTLISQVSDNATVVILIVVFLLNLLSEFVSFSKIIQNFLPLRLFDEIGQTRDRKAWNRSKRRSEAN